MPIDKFRQDPTDSEVLFVLRDPGSFYTHSEVIDLLQKAQDLGFPLERGSYLERLTVRELDILVNRVQ
jgi:hypothetical protein